MNTMEHSRPNEWHVRPFNAWAAVKSGLIFAALFLLLPLGSPWSALSLGSGAIMGRAITLNGTGETVTGIIIHFALAIGYSLAIAEVARLLRAWRGILAGAGMAMILYAINFAIVKFAFPQFAGSELRVAFTHLVFGLFVSAFYKGMTRPREADQSAAP